jgi:hypothetical protein
MPAWIHDRAKHIRSKNPEMSESESFAIATQQAHATGHTPKGFGTSQGKKVAKGKYDEPKAEYVQTADPSSKTKKSSISLVSVQGFARELEKIATLASVNAVGNGALRRSTLMTPPKKTSIPRDPAPPAPMTDLLSSTKTIQPPPVTAGSL